MAHDGPLDEQDPPLLIASDGEPGRLRLVGELDAATGPILLEAGRRALAEGAARLCLDLAELRFVDSAGLRALVLLSREVDGPLALQHPSEMVVRLLEVTGLTSAFALP